MALRDAFEASTVTIPYTRPTLVTWKKCLCIRSTHLQLQRSYLHHEYLTQYEQATAYRYGADVLPAKLRTDAPNRDSWRHPQPFGATRRD